MCFSNELEKRFVGHFLELAISLEHLAKSHWKVDDRDKMKYLLELKEKSDKIVYAYARYSEGKTRDAEEILENVIW